MDAKFSVDCGFVVGVWESVSLLFTFLKFSSFAPLIRLFALIMQRGTAYSSI